MNILVYDGAYGDSGKGRVAAELGKDCHWFVKYNGGANSGHTVYLDGKKYALHHLPAGSLLGKKVALDAGMVINVEDLIKELATLPSKPELYISSRAHLVQQRHLDSDRYGGNVGSTKKGIAFTYSDKYLRQGRRAENDFRLKQIATLYDGLVPAEKDEDILFESNQSVLLDIDYGYYPYVTSSSVFPSGYYKIDKKIMVIKAYTTAVGEHPNITRPEVEWLVEAGGEFGTTTGRKRKCYWNDMRELDYAISISRPDEIVVSKCDILKDCEPHIVNRAGEDTTFSNLDNYISYLLQHYPAITYLSWSPDGKLERID